MEQRKETFFNVLSSNAELRRRIQALYQVEDVPTVSFDWLLHRINEAEAAKTAEFSEADGRDDAA